jgi:hypothetical protein
MDARSVRGLSLVLAFVWGIGLACEVPHRKSARPVATGAIPKAIVPAWVGPAHSGSWYTASRPGEGFTLQILDNGTALAVWFTYPPEGSGARQAWILAQDGAIEGDRIRFRTVFTTRGPRFGAQFDPAALQIIPWGTLELRFADCHRGEFTYAGPPGWGSGTRELTRLTALSELECAGKRRLTARGARALSGLRQRSGALFDPAHNGEGWQFEELPDGSAQVYWFTYDENGDQAWTIGLSAVSGERVVVTQNLQPVGARFGAAFDPARVRLLPWGAYTIDFSGCDRGVVSYASTLPAFGSGTLSPVRLTKLAGTSCLEGTPAVPANGTWSQGASLPVAESEVAIASVGTRSCIAGGYAGKRTFQCYDTATDTWASLAPLPVGRDHALAVALNGELLVTGGNRALSETPANGLRHVFAEDRWESVPELPEVRQNAGTILDAMAYFGDLNGDVIQYDPRTRASRRIAADGRAGRDHAQLLAFQGELWMIGGRVDVSEENARVSIYDPASETWRVGPTLLTARAGFAAAATPTAIIVGGGERLVSPQGVLGSLESIAAGQDEWTRLPAMPFAVHGVGGAIHGNAFYLLGGSRQAGLAINDGRVQVYRWTP